MKINKQITDNVTAKVNELKLTLTNATIELLGMAFDENTDIKLEKPIDITETSTDDKGRVKVETFIVDHILFKRGEVVDGRTCYALVRPVWHHPHSWVLTTTLRCTKKSENLLDISKV